MKLLPEDCCGECRDNDELSLWVEASRLTRAALEEKADRCWVCVEPVLFYHPQLEVEVEDMLVLVHEDCHG